MPDRFPVFGIRRIASSSFLTFETEHRWTPEGETVRRDIVRHPGSVVIVPWDGERVHMLRQFRAAVNDVVLELPAGKLDVAGEDPADTAIRESIEEIGMAPGRVSLMQTCYISPGFTDELSWIYLAEDLAPVAADPQGAEEVHAERLSLDVAEIRRLVDGGNLRDATTLIGLLALLRHIET